MRRRYLLGYDIRDAGRLRRVHGLAKANGYTLQYSVFICDLDRGELAELRADLADIIDLATDSIVLIDLGEPRNEAPGRFTYLGARSELPSGGATIV